MENQIILVVVVLGLAVFALGLDWKSVLAKFKKPSILQGYNEYSFIESPNVLQIKIQIENIESGRQCESLDEMATIVWKYNAMKNEVQKNDTSNLVDDILAKAAKKYSNPTNSEVLENPKKVLSSNDENLSDDYEDFNEVENNQ